MASQHELEEANKQIQAGLALLESSHLVSMDRNLRRFFAVSKAEFDECYLNMHPDFGRLMLWILFAVGAEFLAKGVCLAFGLYTKKDKPQPPFPHSVDELWIAQMVKREGWRQNPTFPALNEITIAGGCLDRLSEIHSATPAERDRLRAAYLYLQLSIRNRDVHGFVQGVRDADVRLVRELFLDELNRLLSWMPSAIAI